MIAIRFAILTLAAVAALAPCAEAGNKKFKPSALAKIALTNEQKAELYSSEALSAESAELSDSEMASEIDDEGYAFSSFHSSIADAVAKYRSEAMQEQRVEQQDSAKAAAYEQKVVQELAPIESKAEADELEAEQYSLDAAAVLSKAEYYSMLGSEIHDEGYAYSSSHFSIVVNARRDWSQAVDERKLAQADSAKAASYRKKESGLVAAVQLVIPGWHP